MFEDVLVGVKSAGDLASGTIHRLHRMGFAVMATEVHAAFAGSICRCTGYVKPVKAALRAAARRRESDNC